MEGSSLKSGPTCRDEDGGAETWEDWTLAKVTGRWVCQPWALSLLIPSDVNNMHSYPSTQGYALSPALKAMAPPDARCASLPWLPYEIPGMGSLSTRSVFSPRSGSGRPRSRCWQGWFPRDRSPGLAPGHLLTASSPVSPLCPLILRVPVCVLLSSSGHQSDPGLLLTSSPR